MLENIWQFLVTFTVLHAVVCQMILFKLFNYKHS